MALPQQPCLVPIPDVIDFGTVRVGCTSELRQLQLVNLCSSPQNTTFATLLTGSGAFSADAGTTRTIQPGEIASYDVEYRPSATGEDFALLQVSQPLGVTLIGRGGTTSSTTETFTVPTKADVLLVVDDSCSMADKQQALANGFATFMMGALDAGTDWAIAVTTTDDVTGGTLASYQGTSVVRPSTPNVTSVYAGLVTRGTNGSGIEAGLRAAHEFLKAPNNVALRSEASLGVVFVTDAHDQSRYPAEVYSLILGYAKGGRRRNDTTLSGLLATSVSPPTGCIYDASEDGRYRQVISAGGGTLDDVCQIQATIGRIGETVFGRRSKWFLNSLPFGAVTTRVNGSLVTTPNVSTFRTTMTFSPAATPRPGDVIQFTYDSICR